MGEDKGLIDENYIRELVGIPKATQIYETVKGLIEYNVENVITVTNSIINEGKDLDNFLWELIKYIKDVLVYKTTQNIEIYNEQEKEQMKKIVENIPKERLLNLIYDLSKLANDIKWSTQKTIMFQAGIINVSLQKEVEQTEINKCIAKKTNTVSVESTKIVENANNKSNENLTTKPIKRETKNIENKETSYWNNVINTLKQNGKMGIYVYLIGSTATRVNDLVIEIKLANKNPFAKQVLEAHENRSELELLVSKELGKPMNIKFVSEEEKVNEKNDSNPLDGIANNKDIPFNIIDE